MSTNYDGLTRNTWPGTWSPNSTHPIALDTELRGTLQSISGLASDRLTDIAGQRLTEGMLVYVKTGYSASGYTRAGDRYYTYRLLAGESRSNATGAMPNAEANWAEISFSGSSTSTSTATTTATSSLQISLIDGSGTVSNTATNVTAIRFDKDSGFSLVTDSTGTVKIVFTGTSVASTATGDTFKFWQVNSQTTLTATGNDTVRFEAGPGIQITTSNTATKTIKFTALTTGTITTNLDGGFPNSVYGGIPNIDAGYI
jgi:hypothetical protein